MSTTKKIQTELGRDLGFITAFSIGVGTMIAAGIFTLSGLAIRNVGSGAIISFGLAALVSLFTALTYCEFVSIYPRSGEGYLYARKTFSAPLAFIVGWALFLGYVSSCSFYISSLSSYFVEFIMETPLHNLSGIIFLIGLTFLNIKGTKESGRFQIIVTFAKVLLLIWFIAGGIKFVSTQDLVNRFTGDFVSLIQTSALVFITFFGFSAIAASAGEVKNPVVNIPKAIFWSVGIVTVLYTGVVIVIIAANLSEYTEAAMGIAAQKFLGGIGGMVIIAGAIFSMVSASNASIMAGSRVALSMSTLGHLPKEVGLVNERTKTPIIAVFLVGGLILIFTMALPLEDLAHFADTVLLFALIMVNIALIVHRRKYPDIERPFKVPLVPVLPVMGILANGYLLFLLTHHVLPLCIAIAALILGFLGFLAWKGAQSETAAIPGAPSKLAVETHASDEDARSRRILVPIANPATFPTLIKLASYLAKEQDAMLIILRVMTVPQLMPLDYSFDGIKDEQEVLNEAQNEALKYGVSVSSVLRIGHDAARAILETAKEKNCELILLGWKGYSTSTDKILGRTTDAVVTHAKRDIMLVKLAGGRPIQRMLLPTAGGMHAQVAELYAASLIHALEGELTVCRVVPSKEIPESELNIHKAELEEARKRILEFNGVQTEAKLIYNNSIVKGIKEASKKYDTVVVGATRDSFYQQILFGSIPENLAKILKTNMIVIKHHSHVRALWGKVISEEA
jgi:amino acid transporter